VAEPGPAPRPSTSLPIRVRVLLPLLLIVLGYASIQLYGRVPERPIVELSGAALGTTWSVKLAEQGLEPEARRAAHGEITRRLERVDALMSTWRDDSELQRFNTSASLDPFPVARETAEVVAVALDVARRSGGALDITVGPLVDAWGFGRSRPVGPPTAAELAALRGFVGWQRIELDTTVPALSKQHSKLALDLSAVAKGYAVDEIARGLESLGHADFLVEVGGELRGRGGHLDGSAWRVAIELPALGPGAGERSIHRVVALRDFSMATSGDYRNSYEREGRRLSHTIDPRTARPIAHALASVTVLHRDAVQADAWATALNVLGPEAGYALANAEQLAAYFILRGESGFELRWTPAFESYFAPRGRPSELTSEETSP